MNTSWPKALSATLPLATATAAPPAPMAWPLTATMAGLLPSNVSLLNTLIATAVSSAVVTASPATSATGSTPIATLLALAVVPSLTDSVSEAAPL